MTKDSNLIFEKYQLISEVLSSAANNERFKKAYGLGWVSADVAFERFNKVRDRMPNKDIFSYGSMDNLEMALRKVETTPTKREEKRLTRFEGADRVYVNDKVTVISPKTYEASCLYGANTKWCSAMKTTRSHWDNFEDQGDILFYFLPKDKTQTKAAILINPNNDLHGFDVADRPVDPENILNQFDVKLEVLQQFIKTAPAARTKDWIDKAIKNRLPTADVVSYLSSREVFTPPAPGSALEKLLLTKPFDVWGYAYDLVKNDKSLPRWYALEEATMKEIEWAQDEAEWREIKGDYEPAYKEIDALRSFFGRVGEKKSPISQYIYHYYINEEDSWPRLLALLLDEELWVYGSLSAAGKYALRRADKWPAYEQIMDRVIKGKGIGYPQSQWAEMAYDRYRDFFYPEERVQIPF